MRELTDVHIHILPGIDDGARNIEEAERMLCQLKEQGVRTLVTTPHYAGPENKGRNRMSEILDGFEKFRSLVFEKHPDIRVLSGSEIYCTAAGSERIVELLQEGNALPINGTKYVLVETGFSAAYGEMLRIARTFNDAGYMPVLAHVERYDCLYHSPARVQELIDHGMVIQMNGQALLPEGFRQRHGGQFKWCSKLVQEGLVHLLGSDAHDAGNRCPNLGLAYEAVSSLFGPEKAAEFAENAELLINGKYI